MKLHKQLLLVLAFGMFSLNALAAPKQKVIFDCDLGCNGDDAYAMALLLTSPEFQVLGLAWTTGTLSNAARRRSPPV